MKTTLERRNQKQIPPFARNDSVAVDAIQRPTTESATGATTESATGGDRRAAVCATVGAAVWAGIAVLARLGIARIGAIELLFLFAPLVIVPLGLELGRVLGGGGRISELARRLQPAGAALAVVAMVIPPGRLAGLVGLGWLLVCVIAAGDGVMKLVFTLSKDAGEGARATWIAAGTRIAMGIAQVDLAVGGAWLVASRLGMRPMGIQEPIGLLTAAHFHFAGFAMAMIGAAMLRFAERRGAHSWLAGLVLMVATLPYVVAAGFVISPAVKMAAAILFSASVAGLAIYLRAFGKRAENASARILLQVAAGAVFAGMILSGTYAIADYLGSDALTIPQMARTHGVLNAVGFCLPGLLGWLVESDVQRPTTTEMQRETVH
jgi:YndJ-like protein